MKGRGAVTAALTQFIWQMVDSPHFRTVGECLAVIGNKLGNNENCADGASGAGRATFQLCG